MTELTSAQTPPIAADEHVRGAGPEAILYLDLGCPHCAATWIAARELRLRLCVRHFPLAAKHPRAPALHAAVEAAAEQGEPAFWALWDSIYDDQAHVDDPHLWQRARALGLELDRFERDRRGAGAQARVRGDFECGVRGGVASSPAAVIAGRLIGRGVVAELEALAAKIAPVREREF